jgi:hypothetical protein
LHIYSFGFFCGGGSAVAFGNCRLAAAHVRIDDMKPWTKSAWFVDLVSHMREAIGDALSEIEDGSCRPRIDMFLQDNSLHAQPQTLTDRVLVTELGKAMTRDRIQGQDLRLYDGLYCLLPSMRRIRESLFSSTLHQHVKIPPTPPVITDGRIPANDFLNEINEQVFIIRVDE